LSALSFSRRAFVRLVTFWREGFCPTLCLNTKRLSIILYSTSISYFRNWNNCSCQEIKFINDR
jgi:hypothetical protein